VVVTPYELYTTGTLPVPGIGTSLIKNKIKQNVISYNNGIFYEKSLSVIILVQSNFNAFNQKCMVNVNHAFLIECIKIY